VSSLTWGFDTCCGTPQLELRSASLTVVDLCIWHGTGTNLSQRQSATAARVPADHARVYLASPPLASATLRACVVDQSKWRRRNRGGKAFGNDCFVPK
jgi:hypothetical protein